MAVQRILRSVQGQPEVTFYVGTTATNADGAVTVTITRANGTVFATSAATSNSGTGRYVYTMVPQSDLELFTLVWSGTFGGVAQSITTQVEIVGGYIISLADLKAESGLSTRTDAQLAEARQWFEDRAEAWCNIAFVPRYARDILDGDGTTEVLVRNTYPSRLLSVKINGTTQTGLTTWDLYENGSVVRDVGAFAWGRRNVEVNYEHGLASVDGDIREAALIACRTKLLSPEGGASSGIPSGVTQLITDAGTMIFGRQVGPFGIREVDMVLNERRVLPVG